MNNDKKPFRLLTAALIGVVLGAVVVYLSDEKKRNKFKEGVTDMMEGGEEKSEEMKEKIKDTFIRGKRNLIKKLREAEEAIEQIGE